MPLNCVHSQRYSGVAAGVGLRARCTEGSGAGDMLKFTVTLFCGDPLLRTRAVSGTLDSRSLCDPQIGREHSDVSEAIRWR